MITSESSNHWQTSSNINISTNTPNIFSKNMLILDNTNISILSPGNHQIQTHNHQVQQQHSYQKNGNRPSNNHGQMNTVFEENQKPKDQLLFMSPPLNANQIIKSVNDSNNSVVNITNDRNNSHHQQNNIHTAVSSISSSSNKFMVGKVRQSTTIPPNQSLYTISKHTATTTSSPKAVMIVNYQQPQPQKENQNEASSNNKILAPYLSTYEQKSPFQQPPTEYFPSMSKVVYSVQSSPSTHPTVHFNQQQISSSLNGSSNNDNQVNFTNISTSRVGTGNNNQVFGAIHYDIGSLSDQSKSTQRHESQTGHSDKLNCTSLLQESNSTNTKKSKKKKISSSIQTININQNSTNLPQLSNIVQAVSSSKDVFNSSHDITAIPLNSNLKNQDHLKDIHHLDLNKLNLQEETPLLKSSNSSISSNSTQVISEQNFPTHFGFTEHSSRQIHKQQLVYQQQQNHIIHQHLLQPPSFHQPQHEMTISSSTTVSKTSSSLNDNGNVQYPDKLNESWSSYEMKGLPDLTSFMISKHPDSYLEWLSLKNKYEEAKSSLKKNYLIQKEEKEFLNVPSLDHELNQQPLQQQQYQGQKQQHQKDREGYQSDHFQFTNHSVSGLINTPQSSPSMAYSLSATSSLATTYYHPPQHRWGHHVNDKSLPGKLTIDGQINGNSHMHNHANMNLNNGEGSVAHLVDNNIINNDNITSSVTVKSTNLDVERSRKRKSEVKNSKQYKKKFKKSKNKGEVSSLVTKQTLSHHLNHSQIHHLSNVDPLNSIHQQNNQSFDNSRGYGSIMANIMMESSSLDRMKNGDGSIQGSGGSVNMIGLNSVIHQNQRQRHYGYHTSEQHQQQQYFNDCQSSSHVCHHEGTGIISSENMGPIHHTAINGYDNRSFNHDQNPPPSFASKYHHHHLYNHLGENNSVPMAVNNLNMNIDAQSFVSDNISDSKSNGMTDKSTFMRKESCQVNEQNHQDTPPQQKQQQHYHYIPLKLNLNQHYYRDDHLKKFVCKICGKAIKSLSSIRDHVRFHDDDLRPHECQECGMSFKRKQALQNHISSAHSHEKPFACQFCSYKASRKDSIRYHYKFKHHVVPVGVDD